MSLRVLKIVSVNKCEMAISPRKSKIENPKKKKRQSEQQMVLFENLCDANKKSVACQPYDVPLKLGLNLKRFSKNNHRLLATVMQWD